MIIIHIIVFILAVSSSPSLLVGHFKESHRFSEHRHNVRPHSSAVYSCDSVAHDELISLHKNLSPAAGRTTHRHLNSRDGFQLNSFTHEVKMTC